jgi:hypothetical protein
MGRTVILRCFPEVANRAFIPPGLCDGKEERFERALSATTAPRFILPDPAAIHHGPKRDLGARVIDVSGGMG